MRRIMSTYRITTRFIPLGSTDRTIDATIDDSWCQTRLNEVNAIYAPAQVEFVFGSLDLPIFDDNLNLDVPPGNDPKGIETARQSHAERFPQELVVFVRHFLKIDENDTRYKAPHYSSVLCDFVIANPGSNSWALAHEFGHFFGLSHTHDDGLLDQIVKASKDGDRIQNRLQILSKLLADAIANGTVASHEALTLLDGDRGQIGDTPPDVGPPIFQPNDVAGEDVGPNSPTSMTINVVVIKGNTATTPIPFSLKPDKLNVMSYFAKNERPHLSVQQANAVHNIVFSGKRRRLIRGRWTNWVPRDSGELKAAPSVISRRPGLVELFGHGFDDRTWQNSFTNGKWVGWFSHGDDFPIGTSPVVGSMSPDHLLLVSCDLQGVVHAKWWLDGAGKWSTWAPLGDATLKGSPSIICRRPGLVELFGRGDDDRTWQNSFTNGKWIGWFSHGDDFPISATPSVGSMGTDHLLLVSCNLEGVVNAKWWLDGAGKWTTWEPLGAAILKGSPSVVCRRPNFVELFGRGLDDRTWQNSFTNGKWIGWFSHGDDFPISATPNVCSLSPDQLQLFVTDPGGAVWQKWWID
jgi:hypothetical protein